MTQLVSNTKWAQFRKLIRDAHDTLSQDVIIWRRYTQNTVPRYREDDDGSTFVDINLKVLNGYNYFRTWPLTRHTLGGELDAQNMIILLNKDYLSDLGFLTLKGYFDYRADRDLFFHRGLKYRGEGDTFLSQAFDDPLFIMIILVREETLTGTDRLDQS